MKLSTVTIVLIFIILSSCSKEGNLVGDYQLVIPYQKEFLKDISNISEEEIEKHIWEEGGNKKLEEYLNLGPEGRKTLRKEIIRKRKKFIEGLTQPSEGTYIRLDKNNLFNGYDDNYIFGSWTLKDDEMTLQYLEKKMVYSVTFKEDYVVLKFLPNKSNGSFFAKNIFLKKQKEIPFHKRAMNEWRDPNKELTAAKRLEQHLDYMASVYNYAIKNKKNKVDINNNIHYSPLRFYGNGISLKSKSKDYYWSSLFLEESQYLQSRDYIENSFRSVNFDKEKNKFKKYRNYLLDMKREVEVLSEFY